MPATRAELRAMLDAEGIRYTEDEDYLRASFATVRYRDRSGARAIFVALRLEEDGEYFKLMAPNLYRYPPDGPNAGWVYRTLLGICWRSKLIKYEYDERDGEIRAIVEFPIEDAELGPRQFMRCLNGLVQIIDEYHPAVAAAMAGGPASLDDAEETADNVRRAERILRAAGVDRAKLSLAGSPVRLEE